MREPIDRDHGVDDDDDDDDDGNNEKKREGSSRLCLPVLV